MEGDGLELLVPRHASPGFPKHRGSGRDRRGPAWLTPPSPSSAGARPRRHLAVPARQVCEAGIHCRPDDRPAPERDHRRDVGDRVALAAIKRRPAMKPSIMRICASAASRATSAPSGICLMRVLKISLVCWNSGRSERTEPAPAAVPHLDYGSFAATSQPRVGATGQWRGRRHAPILPADAQGADQILKS